MKTKHKNNAPPRVKRQGRPSKYHPSTVSKICAAVADGSPFKHAAAVGGISEDTFHEWKRTIPAFSVSVEEAVARGIQHRLKLIKRAADRGDVRAAFWYLEHIHPEHFAKNRIEVDHQGSIATPRVLSDEETLAALNAVLRRRMLTQMH